MTKSRRHPSVNVARHIMYGYRWTLASYWVIFITIFVGIALITNFYSLDAEEARSIWEGASISPKIFLMVIGIMLTPLLMASFVSSGVTRRHFIGGVSIIMVLYAAISALIMTIGYPIEQLVFEQKGWLPEMSNPHLFGSTEQLGLVFMEYFLLFFAYFGSGWLIGSCFYRFHWRIALLLTIVALLPTVLMEAVLSTDRAGELMESAFEIERATLPLTLLLSLLVAAVTIGLNYWMLRQVAIKKKTF